jgi:iron(III) transport system substrate-binding protein
MLSGAEIADAATYAAAKKEGKLVLYSTFSTNEMQPIAAKFQSDTGIAVELIRLPTAQMFDRATSEFAAHRLAADYVDTTDITLTEQLADRGILQGYKVPDFNRLEGVLHDGTGRWYGILRTVIAIGVNTGVAKPADLPSTWTGLLDPRWRGKLGVANIDAGGTSFAFWFFMRQRYGIDAWRKLAAQNPRIGYSVQPVITDLARGETGIAAATIDALIGGVATGSPIKIILPPDGPAFGLYGGVASTAPHPHAAAVWMNWITSEHVAPMLSALGLYSIRRDAPVPQVAGVKMPGQRNIYNIRAEDYVRSYAAFTKEWHGIFGAH